MIIAEVLRFEKLVEVSLHKGLYNVAEKYKSQRDCRVHSQHSSTIHHPTTLESNMEIGKDQGRSDCRKCVFK